MTCRSGSKGAGSHFLAVPCKADRNPGDSCLLNPNSEKTLLVKFGILGFGIWNTARETWNLTNDWNPE